VSNTSILSNEHDATKEPIDVVVADKSPLVLSGMVHFFDKDDRFNLVATAADGERFLEAVDRLKFDVGIIGWNMPYLSGQGVLQALQKREGGSASSYYRVYRQWRARYSAPGYALWRGGVLFQNRPAWPGLGNGVGGGRRPHGVPVHGFDAFRV